MTINIPTYKEIHTYFETDMFPHVCENVNYIHF